MKRGLILLATLVMSACAALGLGVPVGRAVPLTFKESDDHGRCAVSGYEIDFPPHVTIATLASVCVRPFDAGHASDAALEDSPPRAPPHFSPISLSPFSPTSPPDAGNESAVIP